MTERAPANRIGNDPSNMTARVLEFPRQLRDAWQLSAPALGARALPARVWIVGMGGSAIGGDFVRAFAEDRGKVPVEVVRGYALPANAGPGDLAFFVSYSGNTEETLSAWDDAAHRNVPRAVVASGGELLDRAARTRSPALRIPPGSPPRAALGWTSVPVFRALGGLGVFPLAEDDVAEAVSACEEMLALHGPAGSREALLATWAGSAAVRLPVIYAADRPHRATATRWVGQLNENAKTLAHAAVFPEQNHNEIVAWAGERGGGAALAEVALLDDASVHARVRRRLDLVAAQLEEAGGRVTRFAPCGKGLLARLYSLALLGDLASLHAAAARGVDPTPVEPIDRLKRELG